MSKCPNCQQAVAPGDDVCENCGAVLSAQVTSQGRFAGVQSAVMPAISGGLSACPTCNAPVKPGDDVCENCGMVFTGSSSGTLTSGPMSATTTSGAVSAANLTECPRCQTPRKPGAKFCNGCGLNYLSARMKTSGPQTFVASRGSSLKVGDLLNNKYRIVREIGEGGMGAVFLAEDQLLKRQVVIKALLSENDPDMIAQSIKEREFLAAIKHASIVSIYDFITNGQQGYIVMEYVHGKTLDQIMEDQGHPFTIPDAIKYMLGILPAFTYLAKLGLVYCDFKPQNVMLEVLKDGTKIVKLIDLGTVIKYEPKPSAVFGTHGFYAPEAIKSPSPETDLYSICRVLAYLVSEMDLGNPVFGMPSIETYKAFRDNPALYRLLVKGTHSNAKRRFHSAEQLADQLSGVLRQIEGGQIGQPVFSKLFISGMLTTTGKLGLRGEAALDERDKAIDLLRAGDRALRNANYSGAEDLYLQASRTNRKSLDAPLRLAEVALEKGDAKKAKNEIENARKIDPTSWKVTWYSARLAEVREDWRDAIDLYNELMGELPGELPPQLALARVYTQTKQYGLAVDLYKKILKADPGNTDASLGAAEALLQQQNWQEAVQVLQEVNESTVSYVDAQLRLCDIYLKHADALTAQHIEHVIHAIHALKDRTQDPRYYLARGDIYRLLWQMARQSKLKKGLAIPDIRTVNARSLGQVSEESYKQYLHATQNQRLANREVILRRKIEVTPWRFI